MLFTPDGKATNVRLFCYKTTRIKGNMEQLENATQDNSLGRCVGLVEPAKDSNKHLLIARTVVKTPKTVPLRVANISLVGVTVKKRSRVVPF